MGRDKKLSSKHERREKKKADKARIEQLELATTYSTLKEMSVDDLKARKVQGPAHSLNQRIKGYKLQGKTGFALTQKIEPRSLQVVLQVQALMSEALGEGCNVRPRQR